MEILVIGGSRFSGREVIKTLAKKDHEITVVNRGKSENRLETDFLKPEKFVYPAKVQTIIADRTNYQDLKKKLAGKNFDAIIDTCAFNEKDIQVIFDLKFVNLEHYVFISTGSVYDENIKFVPIDEDALIGSEDDDCPIQYSRDKRRAETALKRAYNENQFPMTIIRPTYIYGPNNYLYREMYFFDRVMDGYPILMPGTGDFIVDWVYSKDLAWLLTTSIEKKNAIGQIYNAAGDGGTTLNHYTEMIFEIIGKDTEVIHYNPQMIIDAGIEPENRNQYFPFEYENHFVLSKYKAKYELGYNPISLYDGLKNTFEWYKEYKNPNWKGDYAFDQKISTVLNKID